MKDIFYSYVSTRACYDPAKTIMVCPPSDRAGSMEEAAEFAESSGWKALCEYDGAVLLIPVVPEGYGACDRELLCRLYEDYRGSHASQNGKSLYGRGGYLWCWETLIYAVGYGDGAIYAGNCAAAHPSHFAALALVDGVPDDFSDWDEPTDHWLVKNVSEGYDKKNRDVAQAVWLIGCTEADTSEAEKRYEEALSRDPATRELDHGLFLRLSREKRAYDMTLAHDILRSFFDRIIRWKNGPDGRLTLHLTREEMYTSGKYVWGSVCEGALDYPYAIHLPKGMDRAAVKGLPLVISMHGRGEPAWLFADKNGWDRLADETREFVYCSPDSPGNIWQLRRDGIALRHMIEKICDEYELDRERVYLSGFSNGAAFTREAGSFMPEMFAALSPWNGPVRVGGIIGMEAFSEGFAESGYEMPYWMYLGDNDPVTNALDLKLELGTILSLDGCEIQEDGQGGLVPDEIWTGEGHYTETAGYAEGDRFRTSLYKRKDGTVMAGMTVMKDMPHGAIMEQSRAAWEFMKHFRRPGNGKKIEII